MLSYWPNSIANSFCVVILSQGRWEMNQQPLATKEAPHVTVESVEFPGQTGQTAMFTSERKSHASLYSTAFLHSSNSGPRVQGTVPPIPDGSSHFRVTETYSTDNPSLRHPSQVIRNCTKFLFNNHSSLWNQTFKGLPCSDHVTQNNLISEQLPISSSVNWDW